MRRGEAEKWSLLSAWRKGENAARKNDGNKVWGILGEEPTWTQSPGTPSWWHHSSSKVCVLPRRGSRLKNKDRNLAFLPRRLLLNAALASFSSIMVFVRKEDICMSLAAHSPTWLSGGLPGSIPWLSSITSLLQFMVGGPALRDWDVRGGAGELYFWGSLPSLDHKVKSSLLELGCGSGVEKENTKDIKL